jgi:hypothetical protein
MVQEVCRLCNVQYDEPYQSAIVTECDRCDQPVAHYSLNRYCNSGGKRQHDGCIGKEHCTCDHCF